MISKSANFVGSILCRIEPDSAPLRKLCTGFREMCKPVFTIKITDSEKDEETKDVQWPIDANGKRPFVCNIAFDVHSVDDVIRIYLASRNPESGDPPALISGFPLSLNKLCGLRLGKCGR
jgi:hypothetical protein